MKVSKGYISSFWASLGEGMVLPDEVKGLNLNNSSSIETLVNNYLLHEYKLLPLSIQIKTKESLRYGINNWSGQELSELYNEILPQIIPPSNISIKEFYFKIWNLMFKNENTQLLPQQYEEIPELDIFK